MRRPLFVSFFFAVSLICLATQDHGQEHPNPSAPREGYSQANPPIEPSVNAKPKATDPAKVKQEAEELAKLSAAIPSEVDLVNHGQFPKELPDQLKHIEKLAKHLRTEVLP